VLLLDGIKQALYHDEMDQTITRAQLKHADLPRMFEAYYETVWFLSPNKREEAHIHGIGMDTPMYVFRY
jgi:hypothetical protein